MNNALLLFAGLAFFLFGIDRLSSLLSKLSGGNLQEKLLKYTRKDRSKLFAGITVTMLFQSSNATTVLLVSVASAGFITSAESAAFVLGANLGSVSTAWLIAFKITKLALVIFAIGVLGGFFSKNKKYQYLYSFLTGLGLIFYGLELMSESMSFIKTSPHLISYISSYNADTSILAMLLLVFIGIFFTALVQASGATAAIIISAAGNGLLNLHSASAVMLGATLGTTITALLASAGKSNDGKRVALMHLSLNVVGVVSGCVIFYPMVFFVKKAAIISGMENVELQVALYMTTFKVYLIAVMYPFRDALGKLAHRFIKDRFIDINLRLNIPDLPADSSSIIVRDILSKNIDIFMRYLVDMNAFAYIICRKAREQSLFDKLLKYEKFIDTGHKKIVNLINKSGTCEHDHLWLYLKMSDEAESMADHAKSIAKYGIRISDEKDKMDDFELDSLRSAHRMVFGIFYTVCIKKIYSRDELDECHRIERFVRTRKRELLLKITDHVRLNQEIVLNLVDILAEYSKINHSVKRILQVNLDIIEGRGIYLWDAKENSDDHTAGG